MISHTKDFFRGLEMPVIIDEVIWELAQAKRRGARRVRKSVPYWLFQGWCICGECGHTLTCQQKDATEHRYYSCQGRYKDSHLDGSPRCKLPRINIDLLEKAVWNRLNVVLTDSETLRESMRVASLGSKGEGAS